jgi:hypothetical protein
MAAGALLRSLILALVHLVWGSISALTDSSVHGIIDIGKTDVVSSQACKSGFWRYLDMSNPEEKVVKSVQATSPKRNLPERDEEQLSERPIITVNITSWELSVTKPCAGIILPT